MPVQPTPPAAITYANLRIATLNVRSIINDANRRAFYAWIKKQPIDIIAIQETGNFGIFNDFVQAKWSREWGERGKSLFTRYCGLLVCHERFFLSDTVELEEGRILSAILKASGQEENTLRITNVYLPANDREQPDFLANLDVASIIHPFSVVLGDFNNIMHPRLDRNPPRAIGIRQEYHFSAPWQHVVDALMIPMNLVDTALPRIRNKPYFTHYHVKTVEATAPNLELRRAFLEAADLLELEGEEPAPEDGVEVIGELPGEEDLEEDLVEDPMAPGQQRIILNTNARIDYLMVSATMLGSVSGQEVRSCDLFWPNRIDKLDHRIVAAKIFSTNKPPYCTSEVLDERLLHDPIFVEKVNSLFADLAERRSQPDSPPMSTCWDECKTRILEEGLKYAKKKRRENMDKRRKLTRALAQADATLDHKPRNKAAIARRGQCLADLGELSQYELQKVAMMAKVKWVEEGEKATPYFTMLLNARRKKTTIAALKNREGEAKEDMDSIASIAHEFYSELYSSEPTERAAQDTLLDAVQTSVDAEDRIDLDADLTEGEITSAIKAMAARSSPGTDGLTYSFYKAFQIHITPILLEIFNGIRPGSTSSMPESHGRSLTILLFKKGDTELIGNYRPISLTQCDYKIFTKALTNRINPVADKILDIHQTGFIPKRQGHDNIMLLDLMISFFEGGRRGEASLLSLDQQKAYDRVDWGYLHRCMERFGFGPRLRHWIKLCYTELEATIHLGSRKSDPYQIKRGLRQGDPLAPILFNFVLEPFLLHYSRTATGPPMPFIRPKVAAFADDTNLIMGLGDHIHAQNAIRLHESASGARINHDKSTLIPLTRTAHTSIVIPDVNAVPFGTPFEHLGVILRSEGRNMVEIERGIINKLETTIAGWRLRTLTFEGRVTVLNTYFLSKLWYVAAFYTFSKSFFKELDKLTRHVLWPTTGARVSLHWYRQPKKLGGYGLLNLEHQVKALKAKWLARRQEIPAQRWVCVLDEMVRHATPIPLAAISVLELPTPRVMDQVAKAIPPIPLNIIASIQAYHELDIRSAPPPENRVGYRTLLYNSSTLAREFEVKNARLYLGKVAQRAHAERRIPQTKRDWPAIPRLMPLRAAEVDYTAPEPYPDPMTMPPVPDEEWKIAWERFWATERRPNERHFLFQLYHKTTWTNGYKSKIIFNTPVENKWCRWCIALDPPIETFENRAHAFHDCPRVLAEWDRLRERVEALCNTGPLPTELHQDLLCWPRVADIPPLAIHLHSTVAQSIWQSYCALGDGEKQADIYLKGAIVSAIKTRAKVEQARAVFRDQTEHNQRSRGQIGQEPSTKHYDNFVSLWDHPPHIVVQRDRLEWGEMWSN